MVSAVQIAREYLCGDLDDVVRNLLMTSIAGTMVVRLGVPQEKNSVASLKI